MSVVVEVITICGTISSDKNTIDKDEIIKLDPLPDLETFQPYVNELY